MADESRKLPRSMLPRTWDTIAALRDLDLNQTKETVESIPDLSKDQREVLWGRILTLTKIATDFHSGLTLETARENVSISVTTLHQWMRAFEKNGVEGLIPSCKTFPFVRRVGRPGLTTEELRAKARSDYADILSISGSQTNHPRPKPLR